MLKKLENTNIENIVKDVNNGKNVTVTGLNDGEKSFICKDLIKPLIVVAPTVDKGEIYVRQFESMNLKTSFIKFIDLDALYTRYSFGEADRELNISLFNLLKNNIDCLVVSCKTLNYRLPNPKIFKDNILSVEKKHKLDIADFRKKLINAGYIFTDILEDKGQFSVRGDIIDVFPINSPLPYRISVFDDMVEFIKSFNIENFSSIDEVKSISLCPNTYLFLENQNIDEIISKLNEDKAKLKLEPNAYTRLNNLVENISLEILNKTITSKFIIPYLNGYNYNILSYIDNGTIVFDEPKIILSNIEENLKNHYDRYNSMVVCGELMKSHKDFLLDCNQSLVNNLNKLAYINIMNQNKIFVTEKLYSVSCEPVINYNGNMELLSNELDYFLQRKFFVTIFADSDVNCVNLFKNLSNLKLPVKIVKVIDNCEDGVINISPASLYRSVNFLKERVSLISINEIYNKKINEKVNQTKKKNAFYLPKVGEWVVHNTFGVGICDGIERLKFGNVEKDYIILRYKNDDKYFLPTEKISEISSYISNGAPPKLNKLGTDEFEKEKQKVKSSIKKMAFSLINLYAERQYQKGFRYNIDELLYNEFCKGFEYKETEDQMLAIEDIEKDMQSGKIMDRLICGDVGFGKTEVALRGMFIAAMNGRQVAFLCPTTILSEQHYNACMTRLSPYMVNVEVINRFKTPKQQKEILQKVSEGKVDVLVGTSRLLSKDVNFKSLGLLVLDEEQKFGVEAKEKLKNLKKDIDVLTLSATPIPRTLHISMSGIRDISIIETPPENRLPVQTIVTEYSDNLVKDAIIRELNRNGQVLIINNRVETIYSCAEHISSLVPNAVVSVAHGQMDERTLYNAISDLYSGKTDVLVATTLIENGVDLPTANTIICLNSQNLGLSELYQLKGRVGRSSILAYAYFTYPDNKSIGEDAFKRLSAITEFSSLGSGFKIAMRDLEIRGAGSVLGKEQHGHIEKVGYNMYCKLLKEATEELKGKKISRPKDCVISIDISAFIPNYLITNNEERFRLYNTISNVYSVDEMIKIKDKIVDMYNDLPIEVENLIKIALIQNLASKLGAKQIIINQTRTSILFYKSEDMIEENISQTIKILEVKAIYDIKSNCCINFDLGNKKISEKIDFIINFLSICDKNNN